MAMVTIMRGSHVLKVSRNTYKTIFEKKGYRIVEEDVKKAEIVEEPIETKMESEETRDIETIPISEMNKEQLMKFAEEHNIDTSGARNVREARQIIQKSIRESKM